MIGTTLSAGTVHNKVPADLKKVLLSDKTARMAWEDITPLARNEWICWVEEPKQAATRERRIARTRTELKEGVRRPCCWLGCIHRTDKAISPSVQWVLSRKNKRSAS